MMELVKDTGGRPSKILNQDQIQEVEDLADADQDHRRGSTHYSFLIVSSIHCTKFSTQGELVL